MGIDALESTRYVVEKGSGEDWLRSVTTRSGFHDLDALHPPRWFGHRRRFPSHVYIPEAEKHKLLQLRQAWERRARATFSSTVRRHMRDPEIYGRELAWSESEAACADALLATVRENPDSSDDAIVDLCICEKYSDGQSDAHVVAAVWTRLRTQYPHMFAVAAARKKLSTLGIDGLTRPENDEDVPPPPFSHRGWVIPTAHFE